VDGLPIGESALCITRYAGKDMPKKLKLDEERLLGIPEYVQGTHDKLCVYYSATMVVDTLHRELQSRHGEAPVVTRRGKRKGDVIIDNYPATARANTLESKFTNWFFGSAYIEKAEIAINAAFEECAIATRVKYEEVEHANLWKKCRASIAMGLPLIMGWSRIL
jgi:hypothetical protein